MSLFKQTCWFIFLFDQEAPLWVSNSKFSSAWCSSSLNSELGRSLFLGWDWTWGFWSRLYFPGCVQSCWLHECLHRRVTDNVSLSPLHSPPSALPFYNHPLSQLPMPGTSPKIPLVHFLLVRRSPCDLRIMRRHWGSFHTLLNSFWLSFSAFEKRLWGLQAVIWAKLWVGWFFAAFFASVPGLYYAWTNPGFWKAFRL